MTARGFEPTIIQFLKEHSTIQPNWLNDQARIYLYGAVAVRFYHVTYTVRGSVNSVITRLIVIDVAPLAVLFCICPAFCNCPLLKDISFNTKCLLVWCD